MIHVGTVRILRTITIAIILAAGLVLHTRLQVEPLVILMVQSLAIAMTLDYADRRVDRLRSQFTVMYSVHRKRPE